MSERFFVFLPESEKVEEGKPSSVTGTLFIVGPNGIEAQFNNVVTGGHGRGAFNSTLSTSEDFDPTVDSNGHDLYKDRLKVTYSADTEDVLKYNKNGWLNGMAGMIDGEMVGFAIGLEDKHGRSQIAIHPDFNVPGTNGCLGISLDQAARFSETVIGNVPTELRVVDPAQREMFMAIQAARQILTHIPGISEAQSVASEPPTPVIAQIVQANDPNALPPR